jgi:16S rRNA A1518/A1519 N6-dimethyltransferase RsmA/KsgA/DIM1 with predicted DNA glycosylase/AP lyase activity
VTGDGYFSEDIAARYDADTSGMHDESVIETVVDVLAGLAGDGRALEFGVGTGRIALPLAWRASTYTASTFRTR